jgi:hypothetical protein
VQLPKKVQNFAVAVAEDVFRKLFSKINQEIDDHKNESQLYRLIKATEASLRNLKNQKSYSDAKASNIAPGLLLGSFKKTLKQIIQVDKCFLSPEILK